MSGSYDDARELVVGIDLHRRRTVIVCKDAFSGELVGGPVRITNDAGLLVAEVAKAGPGARVVLEATYGWYWAVDALQDAGFVVSLAHPAGCVGFKHRRVKNDERDAADLADLLRLGRLPQAWIAPREVRERRELVRHRHRLVHRRTAFKNQVHAVLAKNGVQVASSDLFGPSGLRFLEQLALPVVYADRVASLRRLIDSVDVEIDCYDTAIAAAMADDPGYTAILTIPGVGPVLASVFTAEIGDVTRFDRPAKLCSWAGLTPRHHESDTTVHRGRITKQGSALVRWAAVEAVQRQSQDNPISRTRTRISERRLPNIGKIAAARTLLGCVYYGLRDHHIRSLGQTA